MNTVTSKNILLVFTILFFVFLGLCFLKSFGIYEGFAEGVDGDDDTSSSDPNATDSSNEATTMSTSTVTTKAKKG